MGIAQWQRLEARVAHLETWSGPGQMQALLDGQQELRADIAKVHSTLARHERLLTRLKTDMAKLRQTQDGHTTLLAEHTATLENHTATLDSHTATLAEHGAILAWMKQALMELLARVPEQPSRD